MNLRRKILAAVSSLAVASAVLLIGCASNAARDTAVYGSALKETGILTLSVNPEIRIEYNRDGNVTDLSGMNSDGKKIVSDYPDYVGKSCDEVLRDLVVLINEAGYFVEDIDGGAKNIVLQIEPGSVLPYDDFAESMGQSVEKAVTELELVSNILTIGSDDYDQRYASDGQPSPYITLEKAKEIALAQAGVSAGDAVFDDKESDHDDGTVVFELEFAANGIEYEYDIHALTGEVIRAERHAGSVMTGYGNTDYGANSDGITDYNDTDYGPNSDGVTDYGSTNYGDTNYDDGGSNYSDLDDYGNSGYGNTDYGASSDGITDYNDTDYGPNSDGVTDYGSTNYGDTNYDDGGSNYSDLDDYGNSNYGNSNYGDTNYGVTNYDDGGSDYSDFDDYGDSGYDD